MTSNGSHPTEKEIRLTHDGRFGIGDNNAANTLVIKTIPTMHIHLLQFILQMPQQRQLVQTVQDSEIRLGGTSAGHPLQLYAGGSAQITVGTTGGFQFNQGNNNSPTYFNGGASNARNYVNVKAEIQTLVL